jgi:hypothetical protein
MLQKQYWREVYQLKVHINIVEMLLESSEKIDRTLKIILAVSASTSIGAWALWSHLSWVWGSVIASSQVITAINPFLPYRGRISSYAALLHELEELMIEAELAWHGIAEGERTKAEINKARFRIRAQKLKALKKHLGGSTIPNSDQIAAKAEDTANDYFRTFYPG